MASPKIVIIEDLSQCEEAVSALSNEFELAVDCQKIQKGFYETLALLQVGTSKGDVYLFDILRCKELITEKEGDLRQLLESKGKVKVMKGCKNDSALLYHQFGVVLRNVFDVQIADIILEELEKEPRTFRLFPEMTLQSLCEKYGPVGKSVSQYKENIKEKCCIEEAFWGNRPLTDEMKSYAAGNVRVLIPELHGKLFSRLEQRNILSEFESRIKEDLKCCKKSSIKQKRNRRFQDRVSVVLDLIDKNEKTKFSELPRESEERIALMRISYKEACEKSKYIGQLKKESIMSFLDDVEREVSACENEYHVSSYTWVFLTKNQNIKDEGVKTRVEPLVERIRRITLDRMEEKYSPETKIENIATVELCVLRNTKHDYHFSSKISELFWRFVEADFDRYMEAYKNANEEFKPNEALRMRLSSFASGEPDIPKSLKEKAIELKKIVESIDKKRIQ